MNKENVVSVYSGKNGYCCCGCMGKHTYASKFREEASKRRGYPVTDDEVNDGVITRIVNKINANKPIDSGDHIYTVVGSRLYVAYLNCTN